MAMLQSNFWGSCWGVLHHSQEATRAAAEAGAWGQNRDRLMATAKLQEARRELLEALRGVDEALLLAAAWPESTA